MRLTARTLALLLAATTLAAHADTFIYSAYDQDHNNGFKVTSPTLITSRTIFQSNAACTVVGYSTCLGVVLDPVVGFANFTAVTYRFDEFQSDTFFIPPADFLAPGIYPSISIVDNPSTVTPEPSSLVLLATGLTGLTVTIRRRRRTA